MSRRHPFLAIGLHRPVYLWAGPGTVRMNRLKFMNAPVDEFVHHEAHEPAGAARMAVEAGFNWAYLTYDWGFPPEVAQEDWAAFRHAVQVYHAAGVRLFGYVQTSNCVYAGSYRQKEWYALDPRGRPFYYYTGRYMTCWSHPEWLDHLREMVRGVIEAGADGVFFDNPWHGAQPLAFGGAWLGAAGCYCPRCRAAFRQATGLDIPHSLRPETDEASRRYLRWRADRVTETLAMLAALARALKPDVLISVNDFDAVMRPSLLIHGIDLAALAGVQDVMMIENYGLPRLERDRNGTVSLINEALTLRTARPLVGSTLLTVNPYDKGIGFDGVYPPRRFRQAIAEAAACGAAMVVKGTEYVEQGVFTLLTAERFAPQRAAIGALNRWLAGQADLYQGRENGAPVGLLYPGESLWQNWHRWAGLYFGVGQTLLAAGVPWRAVTAPEDLTGLRVLFGFDRLLPAEEAPAGLHQVMVTDLPGWSPPRPSVLARWRWAHALASTVVGGLYRAYFRRRWARRLGDRLGLVHFFLQSPYFRLPPEPARRALLAALGDRPYPRVAAQCPVLVEVWRKGPEWQVHLVNYGDGPQSVRVEFGQPVVGRTLSPDVPTATWSGADCALTVDVYAVLLYRER